MIIKIQYFPDAEDEDDADATTPKYKSYCTSMNEAEAQLAIIQRAAACDSVMEFD